MLVHRYLIRRHICFGICYVHCMMLPWIPVWVNSNMLHRKIMIIKSWSDNMKLYVMFLVEWLFDEILVVFQPEFWSFSFRRVFGATSSSPQHLETESAESAGPSQYPSSSKWENNQFHINFFIYNSSNPFFCKQHCRQETLKSLFQNSTFCSSFLLFFFKGVNI